jgi:azurin
MGGAVNAPRPTSRRALVLLALALAAGAAGRARADDCQLTVLANDMIQFNTRTLHVDASCKRVEITLRHVGKQDVHVLGHDWVLARTSDVTALAGAGMGAGFEHGYLPAGDQRVIAATKVIGGGESTTITIDMAKLVPGGDYTFFCSYPGHSPMMRGRFQVTGSPDVASNRAPAAEQPASSHH